MELAAPARHNEGGARRRQLPSSPEGGQFTSEGDSLLRSKLSGGDTLLRSKLSGGHSAT